MHTQWKRRVRIVVLGTAAVFVLAPGWSCAPVRDAKLARGSASVGGPIDQGSNWTAATRKDFYSRNQGSKFIPLRWITALKQANGAPFMADSLDRYGYLANEWSDPPGLPVGFTVSNDAGGKMLGMTCAACHTRQIEVQGTPYRIDGGPGIVDFQRFLADLDTAVHDVLANAAAFADFARAVLGPSPSPGEQAELRKAVDAWYGPYHTIVSRSLPTEPWGPARLDAVSMIFNRVAGLDIGPLPSHMIPGNIAPATAPVRYPFLWNATIQDQTQWPGFADNGNDVLGLSRNLGEVYGVFAIFWPKPDRRRLLGFDYLRDNSADFEGLSAIENLIRNIGPPRWPWPIDRALATKGKAVFDRDAHAGGCAGCHGIAPGVVRFFNQKTWATPVQDVGTDSREYDVLDRTVQTGVLEGAKIPFLSDPLKRTDKAINVLKVAVVGSILQYKAPILMKVEALGHAHQVPTPFIPETEVLRGAFPPAAGARAATHGAIAYESRVLEGIWAAAPYLHNGSVPTLAELLKPASERVSAFKIGPAYDIENVGLAATQTKFAATLTTTDCSARNSGNSRCGHEFGTTLPAEEKKALLEYLKTL